MAVLPVTWFCLVPFPRSKQGRNGGILDVQLVSESCRGAKRSLAREQESTGFMKSSRQGYLKRGVQRNVGRKMGERWGNKDRSGDCGEPGLECPVGFLHSLRLSSSALLAAGLRFRNSGQLFLGYANRLSSTYDGPVKTSAIAFVISSRCIGTKARSMAADPGKCLHS